MKDHQECNAKKQSTNCGVFSGFLGQIIKFILIPAMIAITVVYCFFPKVEFPDDLVEKSEMLLQAGMIYEARNELSAKRDGNKMDIEFQREYLYVHFMTPKYYGKGQERDDDSVEQYYKRYLNTDDEKERDAGNYLLGLFWSYSDEYDKALSYYNTVKNNSMPYLNNSIGRALSHMGKYEESLSFYLKEIELSKNESAERFEMVVSNYSDSLLAAQKWNKIKELIDDSELYNYVSPNVKQSFYLYNGQYWNYICNHMKSLIPVKINMIYLLIVLIGFSAWLYVIRGWDDLKSKSMFLLIAVIFGGIIISNLVFLIRNIFDLFHVFELRGIILGDFAYCVFMVGFIEEIVKFIPVLIIRLFTNKINKPVDWVIYACLSALGFAVWENYQYLVGMGNGVALGRTFLSIPLHLILSGLIGILVGEAEKRKKSKLVMFIIAYVISSFVHGIFDFMLLGPIKQLIVLAFFVVLFGLMYFKKGLSNILSISSDNFQLRDSRKTMNILIVSFVAIWLTVYFYNATFIPFPKAVKNLGLELFFNSGAFIVFFIISFPILPGEWNSDWYKKVFDNKKVE